MNTKFAKQLTLISLLVISIGAGSCKKYLDQQPITDLSTEVVFNDVPSTYKAIAGVYSRLVGDAGFGIRLSLYYTVDNDEMQGPTGAGDNDRRDIARYAATSGNAQITNPFNQLFQESNLPIFALPIFPAWICTATAPTSRKNNSAGCMEKRSHCGPSFTWKPS